MSANRLATVNRRIAVVCGHWGDIKSLSQLRKDKLGHEQEKFQLIEEKLLKFAKMASMFNSSLENAEEDMTDPVRVSSLEEILARGQEYVEFTVNKLAVEKLLLVELVDLDRQIKSH